MIENIPSKGVHFLDFIAIFAMSYQIFACLLFATTKISENSDGQDLGRLASPSNRLCRLVSPRTFCCSGT
jgi:hypothetical protein